MAQLHLIKMAAGISSLEELKERQSRYAKSRRKEGVSYTEFAHSTRMWPKRMEELLDGGSLYWVFAGGIRARQNLLRFDEGTNDKGERRCRIVLNGEIIETEYSPKRAFQGWRYLQVTDAPPDRKAGEESGAPELRAALKELGLI